MWSCNDFIIATNLVVAPLALPIHCTEYDSFKSPKELQTSLFNKRVSVLWRKLCGKIQSSLSSIKVEVP